MLPEVQPSALPWFAPLVRLIAFSRPVRGVILLAAAVITLLSFTFLHESQTARVEWARDAIRAGIQAFWRRYRRPPVAGEPLPNPRRDR